MNKAQYHCRKERISKCDSAHVSPLYQQCALTVPCYFVTKHLDVYGVICEERGIESQ